MATDKRVGNGAGRTKRSDGASRRSRQAERAVDAKSREVSDEDRIQEFRRNNFQSVLPEVPPIPGFHVMWLTTTNPRDSVAARIVQGYVLVKPHEIPGGEFMSLKTGEYVGCIGVNEMLLAKIPLALYEAYMRHNHHDEPLREEGKLSTVKEVIEQAAAGAARRGRKGIRVELDEGSAELGEDLGPPMSFEETLTTTVAPD